MMIQSKLQASFWGKYHIYQGVALPAGKVDISLYNIQFRLLAARHQSGESLKSITENVESLIKSLDIKLGDNCDYQIASWGELSRELTLFIRKTSDPQWVSVISYVRKRINAKKKTAIHRLKQRRKTEFMLRIM